MSTASSAMVTAMRTRRLLRDVDEYLRRTGGGETDLRRQVLDALKACETDIQQVKELATYDAKGATR